MPVSDTADADDAADIITNTTRAIRMISLFTSAVSVNYTTAYGLGGGFSKSLLLTIVNLSDRCRSQLLR